MLLVYLPGHYIHLIDASSDHEPADSVMLAGAERFPSAYVAPVRGR